MFVTHPPAVGSSQYRDVYTQMLATYDLVETAYAERGCAMPDLHIEDPQELCLVLQRMWHDLQFPR